MNVGWARIVMRFGVLLLNAGLFALAARAFNARDMGIWSLASALTSIVVSLDWGIANYVRNRLASEKREGAAVFVAAVWVGGVLALACIGVATLAAFAAAAGVTLPLPGGKAPWIFAGAVVLLAPRLVANIGVNAFFSYDEPGRYSIVEFGGMLAAVTVAASLIWLGTGVRWTLLGFYAAGTIVYIVGFAVFLRSHGPTWQLPTGHVLRELGRGATPFGILQILSLALSQLPTFATGLLVGIEEVTPVRALIICGQTVLSLHLAHAMPLWTEFSRLGSASMRTMHLVALRRRMFVEAAVLALIFIALALVAPLLIRIWLGVQNTDLQLSAVMFAWAWCVGICNLCSLVLNGRGLPLHTAAALVPGAAVAIALAAWLSPHGAIGVAGGFVAGAAMSALLLCWLAWRELRGIATSA